MQILRSCTEHPKLKCLKDILLCIDMVEHKILNVSLFFLLLLKHAIFFAVKKNFEHMRE